MAKAVQYRRRIKRSTLGKKTNGTRKRRTKKS